MSFRDNGPLPTACIKNLCDKTFEKRKAGAMEVEQLVKTFFLKEKGQNIAKILHLLGQDFLLSSNSNTRKGALLGLASVAIGLEQLIEPIFQALRDTDSHVRYAACEALYNILKVLQIHTLQHLNSLFEALCTASSDPEISVRQVVDHCDRLLRDIVIQNRTIDVETFMDIVSERLYTHVPFTRKFVVCWISTLNSVPQLSITKYIPRLLDGLFTILGDENPDIRRNCDLLLNDFLSTIIRNPDIVNDLLMINTLISHCRESTCVIASLGLDEKSPETLFTFSTPTLPPERLRQITSLQWIYQFIHIGSSKEFQLLPFVASILSAVLPCLDDSDDIEDKTSLKWAVKINEELIKFVHNLRLLRHCSQDDDCCLQCSLFLKIIYEAFNHSSVLTRLAALRWIEVLLSVDPKSVFLHSAELMSFLLKLLSDRSVEVVHSTVSLVGSLCKHPMAQSVSGDDRPSVQRLFTSLVGGCSVTQPSNINTTSEFANLLCLRFLYDLVQYLIKDPQMLTEKGNLIITDLCLVLGAECVYYVMALIISNLLKPDEAFIIVQTLNQILLTQPSIMHFREYLHTIDLNTDAELFEQLYRAWCHNPVSLLAFCLLTQNYNHCCKLVKSFGDLVMSVEILVELDQLIQLLESPVFTRLRMHLVDKKHSAALQETLYCLLMCLPQTEAFDTLRRRLQCLPSHVYNLSESDIPQTNRVNFDVLLAHFRDVQRMHYENRVREKILTSSGEENSNPILTSKTGKNAVVSNSNEPTIPIELGFHQSANLDNSLVANSTEFFVKRLRKLGIETSSLHETSRQ